MNKVILVGRLTTKPELSSAGKTIWARFCVAINRPYKNEDGTRTADFVNCVVFGKNAENISTYLEKGSLISLSGSIQTTSYEDKDGKKRNSVEVNVSEFEFMEPKKETKTDEPATM